MKKHNNDETRFIIKAVDSKNRRMDEAHMLTVDGVWAYMKQWAKKNR